MRRILVERCDMGLSAHATAAGRSPLCNRPPVQLRLGLLLAAGLALFAQGCQRELDMGRVQGQERAATTIRYLGVRGETRLYPDYSALDARILSRGTGASP